MLEELVAPYWNFVYQLTGENMFLSTMLVGLVIVIGTGSLLMMIGKDSRRMYMRATPTYKLIYLIAVVALIYLVGMSFIAVLINPGGYIR